MNAPAFYRFLRSLAGMGVSTEIDSRSFALTPLGEALKKGAPGSARATIPRWPVPSAGKHGIDCCIRSRRASRA